MIRTRTRLPISVALAVAAFGRSALAEEDDVILEALSPRNAAVDIDPVNLDVVRPKPIKAVRLIETISDQEVEERIFGLDVTEKRGRSRIDSDRDSAIAKIDRLCGLTTGQTERLALAGRLDRKRFLDRVEAVRKRIRGNEVLTVELDSEIKALRKLAESGILGPTSFFAKSVRTMLSPDQLELSQQLHQRALVATTINAFDDRLKLEPDQRAAVLKIMQEGIPSIAVFWSDQRSYAKDEMQEMRYHLSLLVDNKLKPLLKDIQQQNLTLWIQGLEGPLPETRLNVQVQRVQIHR